MSQGFTGQSAKVDESYAFAFPGGATTITGTMRWYVPYDIEVTDVTASVSVAPTGATLIADVHKNGTTIFTTQSGRPTIATSGFFDASATPDVTTMLKDTDYFTVDVDQVGSTVPGTDLVIQIRFKRA